MTVPNSDRPAAGTQQQAIDPTQGQAERDRAVIAALSARIRQLEERPPARRARRRRDDDGPELRGLLRRMSAVLTIGGTTIDRVTTRTTLIRCRPYAKDAYPTLAFARCIGTLTPGPDPWDGQPVTLTQNGTLIFAGDTGSHLTHYDEHLGWVREWTCYGLAKRAGDTSP